jgi:hypothetical protein
MHQQADASPILDDEVPADLSQAGVIVDKAIDFMMDKNIEPLSMASALLGGALALLAGTMDEAAIVQILNNAIDGVRAGDLRTPDPVPPSGLGARLRPPGQA